MTDLTNTKKQQMVILLVENDRHRWTTIESWLPADTRTIWVGDVGAAFGILRRSRAGYAGIMLDFNLDEYFNRDPTEMKNGADVARVIVERMSHDIPVLVHSMSQAERWEAVKILQAAGFPVTQIPFVDLTKEKFLEWLEKARECHTEMLTA